MISNLPIIGNLLDRIRLGYVIDFLYFKLINFPVFNVADIFVTIAKKNFQGTSIIFIANLAILIFVKGALKSVSINLIIL